MKNCKICHGLRLELANLHAENDTLRREIQLAEVKGSDRFKRALTVFFIQKAALQTHPTSKAIFNNWAEEIQKFKGNFQFEEQLKRSWSPGKERS